MKRARLLVVALMALPLGAADFAPNPHQTFDGYVSINPPRADVPVGALWIDGYGPTGEPAAPANLETVRSLNGVSIDKNLQLGASAGLFSLLGIDPSLRDHFTAHFTDLTVVRVKDVAQLAGPPGEPRIVEAIKAGGVTVSVDSDIGLNGRTIGYDQSHLTGQTTNQRSRTYSIDGRDLFIAIRVATLKRTAGKERQFDLQSTGERSGSVRIDDYRIDVSNLGCGGSNPATCDGKPTVSVSRLTTQQRSTSLPIALDPSGNATVSLPVPVSDGDAGLFTKLAVHLVESCRQVRAEGCGRGERLFVRYLGERLESVVKPHANGW